MNRQAMTSPTLAVLLAVAGCAVNPPSGDWEVCGITGTGMNVETHGAAVCGGRAEIDGRAIESDMTPECRALCDTHGSMWFLQEGYWKTPEFKKALRRSTSPRLSTE